MLGNTCVVIVCWPGCYVINFEINVIFLIKPLRLGLSHLREQKFKHSFQDSLNPFCSCGKGEVETSSHYLLHCSNYSKERLGQRNTLKNIAMSTLQQSDSKFTSVLLFGDTSFDNNKNIFILTFTGRFDVPLFSSSWLAFVSLALQMKSCIQYSYKFFI